MMKKIFVLFIFFIFTNYTNAKQIKVTSDKLEIIRAENISIFSGNVYALEDNLMIWSDTLILTSSEDEKTIEAIDALSNVKILRDELSINGDEANYDPIKDTLIVIGDVKVKQNDNIVLCDEIVIDLVNSSSIMKSDSAKRVEALIITENKN
tara:strand:+ start:680 stop:1135 length:456 start_codon:yes stop_codon:yes gene_type:complete